MVLQQEHTKAVDTLKSHKLRITETRTKVLGLFMNGHLALKQSDVEDALGTKYDRVTIYRTLNSFLESGIIHKIPDDSGATQYALCDNCDAHEHHDEHIHFKCTKCNKLECLDHYTVPKFEVPLGYTVASADMVVIGICAECT